MSTLTIPNLPPLTLDQVWRRSLPFDRLGPPFRIQSVGRRYESYATARKQLAPVARRWDHQRDSHTSLLAPGRLFM